MNELFRLQLVSLSTDTKSDGAAVSVLIHVETASGGSGRATVGTDKVGELNSEASLLAARLSYAAASVVSQVEDGVPLSRSAAVEKLQGRPQSTVYLSGGGRLFLLHPIEGNTFLVSLLIPPVVWSLMGPVSLQVMLATAVSGYEISPDVAAVSSVPMYYSLRDRITESPAAVEKAVHDRFRKILEFATYLKECQHDGFVPPDGLASTGGEGVRSLQRMCYEFPGHSDASGHLTATLQQLIWSATSPTDVVSLSGAIASGGMREGYKRLVVTAATLWYRGRLLFHSGSFEDYALYLLPVGVVAFADKCLSDRKPSPAHQPVAVKCFAMQMRTGADCLRTVGYSKRHDAAHSGAGVCLSFVSSKGWVIVLQTEAALNSFAGASVQHLVTGVTNLITTTLQAPRFGDLVEQFAPGRLVMDSSRAIAGATPFLHVARAIRHLGVFEHHCAGVTYAPPRLQDFCTFRYSKGAADSVTPAEQWLPWPRHLSRAALGMVSFSCRLLRHGHGPRLLRQSNVPLKPLSLSVLRGPDATVVLLTVPLHGPKVGIALLLMEVNPEALVASVADLRAFARWFLTRVV
ncbi:hypothetical protein ERJ75_001522800 [Trypanosoma vivax]|uniref:Uncharacterized protein n=1 Tax=Trypanosoma vivax (strain Y486) TaxID=1055687 RepID=G0UBB2_TRYVY|nr:hypothetical protein TRVL_06933 [Trypanosoma vivax]KAH8606262.1 hypothetical protein ERJ75_001522800 [Trypanosoma vivax]CCC53100.1 conserved hypothetical protein [Trypanosoma vivax Y486]